VNRFCGLQKRLPAAIVCLGLVLLAAAVYSRGLTHDFVNYDDPFFVTDNPDVKAGLTWKGAAWSFSSTLAFWNPLARLSHMLDCELFGLNPAGHHLSNMILHTLNAVLLFLVLWRMTGALWRSALVAALFAVHPQNVESVAWVSERKGLLCALFWFLGLGAYVRYAARPGWGRYAAVLVCFALSLMAKPMAVTFPAALLLLDFWPLARYRTALMMPEARPQKPRKRFPGLFQRSGPWIRLTLEKAPLFALSAGASILAVFAEEAVGALTPMDAYPLISRITNALVSYAAYLGQAIVPVGLAPFYPFPPTVSLLKAAGAALLLGLISAGTWRFRRGKPYLLKGWLWFLITLLPVIGLIKIGGFSRADRYAYLPMIGLWVAGVWLAAERIKRSPWQRVSSVCLSCVVILGLGMLSFHQVGYWKDSETLFGHALRVTQNNYLAHNNLGLALDDRGRHLEAVHHFREVLAISPDLHIARRNLGASLAKLGRFQGAEAQFRRVLQHPEYRRNDAETWSNLGLVLALSGKPEQGAVCLRRALAIRPYYAPGHYNLGLVRSRQGRLCDAVREYRLALRAQPEYARAHNNLGATLLRLGRLAEAEHHLRECLKLDPACAEARKNLLRLYKIRRARPQAPENSPLPGEALR
jgi:Flp pilus assembly protein TadD